VWKPAVSGENLK